MIYNFRFDRGNREEIIRRIEEERYLSQGWGGGKDHYLSLKDAEGFRRSTKEVYNLKTTRVPSNLTRIRDFQDGDLLVTPHLPDSGKVSIHIVDGDFPNCYAYLEGDPTHLNHRIRIRESFGLDGKVEASNERLVPWKAKLPWLRLPVLPIKKYGADFQGITEELRQDPERSFEASELERYLQSIREELVEDLRSRLQKMPADGAGISFEALCKELLRSAGHRIRDTHQYDGEGGDIDFLCVRDRSDATPFEMGESILYVQVKKHKGKTDDHAVNQLLKMLEREPSADGCVITLADGFTEEATRVAESNGISLIGGKTVCQLVLQELNEV